jgi:hypothetical protein
VSKIRGGKAWPGSSLVVVALLRENALVWPSGLFLPLRNGEEKIFGHEG